MVTAAKLPTIVNGVNVDNLFTTIDAIKTAPPIATFNFVFRTNGKAAAEIVQPSTNSTGQDRNSRERNHSFSGQTSLQFCWVRTRQPILWNIFCMRWPHVSQPQWSITQRHAAFRFRRSSLRFRAISICTGSWISIQRFERDIRAFRSISKSRPTCLTRN